jgi:asparagine synthase (glutamine-hydrolysing)
MSGICGIIYFDGKTVENEHLLMLETLKHRGVDGIEIYKKNSVALVHLALNINYDCPENQLFISKNDLIIVADARIDDSQKKTILALYEQYGDTFIQSLVGDFAFVIYDLNQQKIIAARDHAGARPLYYVHKPTQYFAFASEIKALLALPFVEKTLNPSKILRYAEWSAMLRPPRDETFYKNIKSVCPAHTLVVNKEQSRAHFCWNLNLNRFDYLKTDDDYVAAFKETFVEAVRCRVQSPFGVSSHLSGGLDSSSVSVVARQLFSKPVHTLHLDVGLSANEKPFAEAVLQLGGFAHQYIYARPNLLESNLEMANILDRPDHFTLLPVHHLAVADAVKTKGHRVLLTGHDGDSVVGFGRNYVHQLIDKKDWKNTRLVLENYAKIGDFSNIWPHWNDWDVRRRYQQIVHTYTKPVILRLIKQQKITEATQLWWQITQALDSKNTLYLSDLQHFVKNKARHSQPTKWFTTIETDYGFDDVTNALMADITHEGMYDATEQFEHIGAHYGHEVLHPFYDRRLVELCLVIPERLKFDNGYRRGPLRRAMAGLLPETVRLRTSKVHFDEVITTEIQRYKTDWQQILKETVIPTNFSDAEAVYLQKLLTIAAQQLRNPEAKPIHYLRALHLAQWLGAI